MPIDYGINNVNTSGIITATSGNFINSLQLNGTGVSVSGHAHTSSDIINFNSSVSGLLPVTNIINGNNIVVSSTSGIYTISTSGVQNQFVNINNTITGNTTISASRALIYNVLIFSPVIANISLPSSGHLIGDIIVVASTNSFVSGSILSIINPLGQTLDVITRANQSYRYISQSNGSPNAWVKVSVDSHTHISDDITNFNSSVSGLLPTISNSGDNRVLTSTGSSVGINAESNLTFDGTNLSSPRIIATQASADEGGELQLAKAPNSSISGAIIIDAYQNKLRFFEQSGTNRGFYLDLSTGGAAASTNIASGGGGSATTVSNYGDNRIITSDGTTTGLNAETNFTFDGSLLSISGSGSFSNNITASGFVKSGGTNSQFLKADGSVDSTSYQSLLTNPVTGTGIVNHIPYWSSTSGLLADSNQLIWDASNNRLGIGTTTPSSQLHVIGSGIFTGDVLVSGSIVAGSGTAALPTFEFINDTDTGMFSPATNAIGFATSGVERLRINDIGNVGIGTTSPSEKLEINGFLKFANCTTKIGRLDANNVSFATSSSTLGHYGILIDNTATANGKKFRLASWADGTTAKFIVRDDSAGVDRFAIDTAGNVGIGITSPGAKLDIGGSLRVTYDNPLLTIHDSNSTNRFAGIELGTAGGNWYISNGSSTTTGSPDLFITRATDGTSPRFRFARDGVGGLGIYNASNNTETIFFSPGSSNSYINGGGNFGIGTSNPSVRLHVEGDGKFNGNLTVNSGVIIGDEINYLTGDALIINFGDGGGRLASFINGSVQSNSSINLNADTTFNRVDGAGSLPFIISPTGYAGSGAVTQGFWRGSTIEVNKGGTGRTTYSNGQLLIGSGTSLVANTLTAGTGISITNGSGTITINTSGLQTALTNPVTGTGIASHIAYWNSSSGIVADSGQLYWDSTNDRLGIGTTAPSEKLDVVGNIKTGDLVLGYNATFDQYGLTNNNGGGAPLWIISDLASMNLYSSSGITLDGDVSTVLQPNTGNVGIGNSNPSSKLDVTGDVNIDGNLTFDSFTESVVSNGNSGTSKTLSLTNGTVHTCTLTGNCTFTMPATTAGKSFTMFLNTGSGNYTASFSGVRWADSATPTATILANKVDIYSFISDGSYWYGSFSQNYG